MAGTKAGGLKAVATNYERHGRNFYREIGRRGGQNGHTGGFAANPALAKIAGRKGGRISRRGKVKKTLNGFSDIKAIALIGALALVFLAATVWVIKDDARQRDQLTNLHAAELSVCWSEVEEGEVCRIEYLKDRTDTIYSAKVVKESAK